MAATNLDGPQFVYGNTAGLPNSTFGGGGVPDPNTDAGPSGVFQGAAFIDTRLVFPKDKVTGFTGVVQSHWMMPFMQAVNQIPATLATNNIAAAAAPTSGTAMTLASASTGITRNVPIAPFSASLNGAAVVTAAIALDFGFGFGNVTSGSTTVVVSEAALFWPGMPIVIGGVGNAGGTVPLLTLVRSLTDATHIVIADAPLATNATAPIGTGNLWGPSQNPAATPTAAYPFIARGPALVLDPRQGVSRIVRITATNGGASGGNFTVAGWDIYNQPMTETLTHAGGATTISGRKAFKYVNSVTPAFTDAQTYAVGTGDVFGFAYRTRLWENARILWASSGVTTSTGYTAAVITDPATATTGDVRGTYASSSASNGTISSLVMSGRRLMLGQYIAAENAMASGQADSQTVYGVTQA